MPSKTLQETRKSSGLCICCGNLRDGHSTIRCNSCLEKGHEAKRRWDEKRRAEGIKRLSAGMCAQCGSNPPFGFNTRCEPCLNKERGWPVRAYNTCKIKLDTDNKWVYPSSIEVRVMTPKEVAQYTAIEDQIMFSDDDSEYNRMGDLEVDAEIESNLEGDYDE